MAAKGAVSRWLRIAALAFGLFVLPFLILLPATPYLIEFAREAGSRSPTLAFVTIIGLFCLDAAAFIPNGLVGALAAQALDWPAAAASVWIGLMTASSLSYALGYFAGRPLARKIVGADDLAAAQERAKGITSLVLFMTRPVPVIGETILVASGIASYPFRRFFVAVGSANVFVTATYVGLGKYFGSVDPERVLIIATVGIPLVAGAAYLLVRFARSRLARKASAEREN
ncbi:VTT domain-containing protein [Erythrobacter sp. HKB08]|uniref:VTT domain-containing protein n=1 Tax=Erythrobacter sp. HKB08 TaxID=2502843 RepID=UPI0013E8B075|nr:VTT domain-containing protein [Erythrobacter sp. HKB08]